MSAQGMASAVGSRIPSRRHEMFHVEHRRDETDSQERSRPQQDERMSWTVDSALAAFAPCSTWNTDDFEPEPRGASKLNSDAKADPRSECSTWNITLRIRRGTPPAP